MKKHIIPIVFLIEKFCKEYKKWQLHELLPFPVFISTLSCFMICGTHIDVSILRVLDICTPSDKLKTEKGIIPFLVFISTLSCFMILKVLHIDVSILRVLDICTPSDKLKAKNGISYQDSVNFIYILVYVVDDSMNNFINFKQHPESVI